MLEWDDYRLLLAIARQGSLTSAARVLGVTQPTMGRRLEHLESRLGSALFDRTASGVVLTNLGSALLQPAEQMEQAALAGERRIAAQETGLEGLVRITTLEWVGHHVLSPILGRFCRTHPGVTVELLTADRVFSLARHETDLALRATRFEQDGLVQRRVGATPRGLYASKQYLSERGWPDFAAGCHGHSLIVLPEGEYAVSGINWLREDMAPRAQVVLRTNSIDAQLAACAAGAGLALLPALMAERHPGLQRLDTPTPPPVREFWLGFHEDLRHTRRVRELADHIAAEMRR